MTGNETSLEGQLLIAMPGMEDSRFAKSVVYMCAHSEDGAMGIVINQASHGVSFPELLDQLEIETATADDLKEVPALETLAVQTGGPVETGRGFVLHSSDYYAENSTLEIDDGISLTATLDILKAIAAGEGPDKVLLALGYAGWAPGQLENEMKANGWLHCKADSEIIFSKDLDGKYDRSLASLGIDLSMLSSQAGRA